MEHQFERPGACCQVLSLGVLNQSPVRGLAPYSVGLAGFDCGWFAVGGRAVVGSKCPSWSMAAIDGMGSIQLNPDQMDQPNGPNLVTEPPIPALRDATVRQTEDGPTLFARGDTNHLFDYQLSSTDS